MERPYMNFYMSYPGIFDMLEMSYVVNFEAEQKK